MEGDSSCDTHTHTHLFDFHLFIQQGKVSSYAHMNGNERQNCGDGICEDAATALEYRSKCTTRVLSRGVDQEEAERGDQQEFPQTKNDGTALVSLIHIKCNGNGMEEREIRHFSPFLLFSI